MSDGSGTTQLTASSRVPAGAAFVLALSATGVDLLNDLGEPPTLGFVFWLAVITVVLASIPQRIAVGAEGMRIAWLARARFVRYSQIVRARPVMDDVELTLAGGRTLRLNKSPFGGEPPRIVLGRLWSTVAAGAESGLRPNERAVLARAGRRPRVWIEALRSLTPHGTQYRQGLGLDLARLWSIVENPAVETELRGAAAIAVAASLDGANRARLREIAGAAVEPALRAALERIADADHVPDLETVAVQLMLVK